MSNPTPPDAIVDRHETSCCIVGGGPGGMALALLLARKGVPVTLLEAHADFDREFRGDTIHPSVLEVLDQIGLADRLLEVPHVKWLGPSLVTAKGPAPLFNFRQLRTRFPFIAHLPQERFLEFLAAEAARYPHFRLVMKANVQRLIEENGIVRGVRYRAESGWREVRAPLTIGADGRFSRVRHLAGIEPIVKSDPMELLWFRLPRSPGDVELESIATVVHGNPLALMNGVGDTVAAAVCRGNGFVLGIFNRVDHWQVAYFYPPGTYGSLKSAGLEAFRARIADREPRLVRHLAHLTDWNQLAPLSVAFSRCRRWHRPGLLLIGDAAHVMTPAAGAGIKYAIEDAVEAANVLTGPLRVGRVRNCDLAEVQRRREWPTRVMQWIGARAQQNLLKRMLRPGPIPAVPARPPFAPRLFAAIPFLRDLPARFIAFGLWRVRLDDAYCQGDSTKGIG